MPRRGEVWLVDLGLAQKTRPAVVLSVAHGSLDRVVVTVLSHTTAVRGSAFEVSLAVPFLREGAFVAQSITTIPTKHALRRLGTLTTEQLAAVEDAVRRWLGL